MLQSSYKANASNKHEELIFSCKLCFSLSYIKLGIKREVNGKEYKEHNINWCIKKSNKKIKKKDLGFPIKV